MPATVIVGAQWGDEGKGKIVDRLAASADVVVRYAGGPNAGHTLVVGTDRLVLRLLPSGVMHPTVECVLGQGMVICPSVLLAEIDGLGARGIALAGRLHVSERAHLILPHHVALDELRESSATGTKIGTTKRGIGPCYEDKIARRGVRLADLRDPIRLRARVSEALAAAAPTFGRLGATPPTVAEVCAPLGAQAERLLPLCADGAAIVDRALAAGKRVMLEGAQGTMLDIDHGTYPFVTSSSSVAGGACTGAGVGPTRIDRVIGITKAYTTRVGAGPFPTELDDPSGEHLRAAGHEYGSVTGRPRRTGWLDLVALRHAHRVNGLDALALTKLDVLGGLPEVCVCVGYELAGRSLDELPAHDLAAATPILRTFPGWSEDIGACRTIDSLPARARDFVLAVEQATGLPLLLVSVGPEREQTIVRGDALGPRAARG